jgi:hypothetical protein
MSSINCLTLPAGSDTISGIVEKSPAFKGIKDVFYETRVLMGRDYSLRRFAREVLDGAVDPVMLSYIEKGKRFPTDPLVRKLASVRKQDPGELLVLLCRDRILYAFSRELRRVIRTPKHGEEGMAEGDLAYILSRAIAAFPESGRWMPVARWTEQVKKAVGEVGKKRSAIPINRVLDTLKRQGLIEHKGDRVRRGGRHYMPESPEETRSLAIEFCGIFSKGLLEKFVRRESKSYIRNYYLHIPEKKIETFHRRVDAAVRQVVKEFAVDETDAAKFINVLTTSTPM